MRSKLLKWSIFLAFLSFLFPFATQAQETSNEFRISIYRSKITGGASASFFNTTVFGIEYQHKILETLNMVAGTRFVQFIAERSTFEEAHEETSKSFLTFDAGLSLIPFITGETFQVRFSPGLSIRHRNEVITKAAYEFEKLPVLVQNDYQSRWDIGGFFNLGFLYSFNDNWFVELRGQFHTYDKGDAVFDMGISIGRKF